MGKQEWDMAVFARRRLVTELSLSSEYSSPASFLTKSCFQRKKKNVVFKKKLCRVLISGFPSSGLVKEYLWGNTQQGTVSFHSILIFFASNKKSLHKQTCLKRHMVPKVFCLGDYDCAEIERRRKKGVPPACIRNEPLPNHFCLWIR